MIRFGALWLLLALAVAGREAIGESLALESRVAQQRALLWLLARQEATGGWPGDDLMPTARAVLLLSRVAEPSLDVPLRQARALLARRLPELPPGPVLVEVCRTLALTGGLPASLPPPAMAALDPLTLLPPAQMGWLELCYLGVLPATPVQTGRVRALQQALRQESCLALRLYAALTLPEPPWSATATAALAEAVQAGLDDASWPELAWSVRALVLYEHRQPPRYPVRWRNRLLALLLERQNSQGSWGETLNDALLALQTLQSAR